MGFRNCVVLFGRSLFISLWKIWIVHRRHYMITILEFILPLSLSWLLAYLVMQVGDIPSNLNIKKQNATRYSPFKPILSVLLQRKKLLYAPNTVWTKELLETALKDYRNLKLIGVNSEKDAEEMADTDHHAIIGVVIFTVFNGTDLPSVLNYKLRISSVLPSEPADKTYVSSSPQQQQQLLYDFSKYEFSGFLALQTSIDLEYIKMRQKKIGKPVQDTELLVQRMPYPPHENLDLESSLQEFIPVVIICGFLLLYPIIANRIVDEKNNRAKELMKMMGMTTATYWGSAFISNFIIMFIISFIITIIYCTPFNEGITVLAHSSVSLFFVILLLYCASALLFCFVITTLFTKVAVVVTTIVIVWVVTLVLSYTAACDFTSALTTKVLVCLIPNIALTWTAKIMSVDEQAGIGSQWSNLLTPPFGSHDSFSMGSVLGMMLVSCVTYTLLLCYLDAVWPWQPGVPKSPLFFFSLSYWIPSQENVDEERRLTVHSDSTCFEDEPTGLSPTIVISHLIKVFKTEGNEKKAVDDLSLNIYPGQITALLGHNGAGKSTTMNILTGIFPPTNGKVLIDGHDIVKSTNAARRSLGLCPQYNVLYDNLTVEEHLKLFAGLKGLAWSEINDEITKLLKKLKLQDKQNTLTKDLSGGMKRKLCLGIAVVGPSQVVILDEPTTGMDPEARRVIWDLLQHLRPKRTILLTTHYMEEADALGDRVAIMANGSVQCCGSVIFLKRKFGTGYHIKIEKSNNCQVEDITSIIKQHIPEANLVKDVSLELTYSLSASTAHFSSLFTDLEVLSQKLGIASFGVTVTTMDDVFLKVGQIAEKNTEIIEKSESAMEECVNEEISLYSSKELISPLSQQVKALLMKRVNYTKRHLFLFALQLSIPLVAFMLFVYFDITPKSFLHNNEFNFDLSEKFNEIKYGFINLNKSTPETISLGRYYNNTLKRESVIVYGINDPEDFLINKGINDINLYTRSYLVGGSISKENSILSVKAWYNGIHHHLSPISINLMTNALLQYTLNDSSSKISITSHPLPRTGSKEMESEDDSSSPFIILFLPLGLTFLSSTFVLFPIHEKMIKAKLLQRMCGVNGTTYWLTHILWDFLVYFLCCLEMLIPLFIYHGINKFVSSDAIGAVFLCLLLYGLSSLSFIYVLSFILKVPSTGFSFLTILNCFTGIIATLVMLIIQSFGGFVNPRFQQALQILRLFPAFSVTWGINNIHTISKLNIKCHSYSKTDLEGYCGATGKTNITFSGSYECCSESVLDGRGFQVQYLEWKNDSAGKECLYLILTAAFWLIVTILMETTLPKIYHRSVAAEDSNAAVIKSNEESDVSKERQRIQKLFQQNAINEEALVVSNLTKCFGTFYAVSDLTFGVHKEECFGLLGINGAGKTTTFRMLVGDLIPTRGNAYINSSSIQADISKFQKMIGYCPQFDALINWLNGRETLYLFANLRGIPVNEITQNVNGMIEMCDLKLHADKPTKTYSGGTKRKLSLGVSLIGAPPIVLLDEPTAGVDPISRRKIWKTLLTMKKLLGVSFILTSHSMDECEILCNRLAIMVNGQFCCLGAMQSLKSKFGQGFSLVLKLSHSQSQDFNKIQEVKADVKHYFPSIQLKVEHFGILNYHITDTSLKWSYMFATMEDMKKKYELDDYILSDTTLEQIFLAFAHTQKGLT